MQLVSHTACVVVGIAIGLGLKQREEVLELASNQRLAEAWNERPASGNEPVQTGDSVRNLRQHLNSTVWTRLGVSKAHSSRSHVSTGWTDWERIIRCTASGSLRYETFPKAATTPSNEPMESLFTNDCYEQGQICFLLRIEIVLDVVTGRSSRCRSPASRGFRPRSPAPGHSLKPASMALSQHLMLLGTGAVHLE